MSTLNEITDEGATSLVGFYQCVLKEDILPQDRFEAFFNLGLIAWRAGDLIAMNQQLGLAAEEAVLSLERCDVHDAIIVRTPHIVAIPMLIVMSFGNMSQLQRLAKIKRQQFFQPENRRYQSLADLLDMLRLYFAGEPLRNDKLNAIERANEQPGTDLFYEPMVGNLVLGIQSIIGKNTILAERCFLYLVKLHARLAKGGEWGKLAEGLMALWALTLVCVAKKEQVVLNCASEYVPVI